ncbi:MAG TPA: M14 family zinc carboxypeptidase, partial [Herpetosiphonaceae bacterium]
MSQMFRWGRVAALIALLWGVWAAGAGIAPGAAAQPAAKAEPQQAVARIRVESPAELLRLSQLGLDLLEHADGADRFALVRPDELDKLRAAGFAASVDGEQTRLVRERAGQNTVQGGFRTVEEGYALLDQWQGAYPNLAQTFTYGQSWDRQTAGGPPGYELRGITVTNKLIPGPKPPFVLISAIHAREMATAELTLRYVEYLLSNYGSDPDVTWLLNEHQVVVMPFVNPDGRKDAERGIYQRKNKNTVSAPCSTQTSGSQPGVDLNRNSHFKWGTVDMPSLPKCSQTYPGPTVASEPEVSSLEAWVSKIFRDQRGPNDSDPAPADAEGLFITLHSYGDLVLWPYGWGSTVAPNDADLSGLGRKFASYNSYTPQKSSELYPTSGATDDWTYGDFGVASYTFEVGPDGGGCAGFMPPFACLDGESGGNFWGRNRPAFLYAHKAARTPYLVQRGPDTLSAQANGTGPYQLAATINDTLNGNQAISAAEAYLDTPPWRGGTPIALSAADGAFNSPAEAVQGTIASVSAGRHLVYLRGRDAAGNWGPFSAAWLNGPTLASGLRGKVTAADNSQPIAGATVTALAPGYTASAVTNASGDYELRLPAGTYALSARRENHRPANQASPAVQAGQFATANLALTEFGRLEVQPAALSFAAAPGGSQTRALTLANPGGEQFDAAVSLAPAGYGAVGSAQPGGPAYAWAEINATGTRSTLDDDACAVVALPRPFSFYGASYSSVGVHSNGFLTMGSANCSPSDGNSQNPPIPTAATPNALIAGLWDDLDPSGLTGANGIFTHFDAATGRFIAEWSGVPHYSAGDPETFQIILDTASGTVLVQYKTVGFAGSATAGIEDAAGAQGVAWSNGDGTVFSDGLAVEYREWSAGSWLSLSPAGPYALAPRGSAAPSVTASAAG